MDKPKPPRTLDPITNGRQFLQNNRQLHVLPVNALEEYYPNNNGWKKSSTQIASMGSDDKVKLAKLVGNGISQSQFESEMPIVHGCLTRCWELAFGG